MSIVYATEAALCESARQAAVSWLESRVWPLVVGLEGGLGAGKTTWVRAMLRGLGYSARVPSPTFTLLEHYEIGTLTVVHLDLYRLADAGELEFLGIRDWLERPNVWLLVEWPERGGRFAESVDLTLELEILPDEQRELTAVARTAAGREVVSRWLGQDIK
ncbi:MAG TPA: tRNA (adenosine(37)-N6)-threonylcarbamoyltransferase complex ATPase subunit type 1 TsaE [Gammaproteobacteria bacterium]